MRVTPPLLIVVDDDIDDIEFFSVALKEIKPECEIKFFLNGIEFLNYFKDTQDDIKPIAIAIDINMPFISGLELLTALKVNHLGETVPLYIITTANADQHEKECLELGAKKYFTKPVLGYQWQSIVKEILTLSMAS